jgi:anti-sigma regulatory factor (Ser/Thr protein kinase)
MSAPRHAPWSPELPGGAPWEVGESRMSDPGFPGLELSFDSGSLYVLRAAVAAHAAAAGLSRLRVHDIVAAAHELAANAVRHGAGQGQLRLWAEDQYLRCEVSDEGKAQGSAAGSQGPDMNRGTDTTRDPDTRWLTLRGHGLWLVDQVADQVSVDHGPGGTTATMAFIITPGEPGASGEPGTPV